MNKPIRYIAEPSHVREVSLHGTADLSFWTTRLRQENLLPLERDGRAQILIVAAEMTFMGIRFTEVSFSVLVDVPGHKPGDAVFMVHAFNSFRLFAFCERRLFATPYSHAECHVSTSARTSICIILRGGTVFRAEIVMTAPALTREPSRSGDDGWEGAVFLPGSRHGRSREGRVFFGKVKGHTQSYPFVPSTDVLSITPCRDADVLQVLIESGFTATEWLVRPDARHGKSKSHHRRDVFGSQNHLHAP